MNHKGLAVLALTLLVSPIASWKLPRASPQKESDLWNPAGLVTEKAKSGERCGGDEEGIVCEEGLCCSEWGFCGRGPMYCAVPDCQYQDSGCETRELPKGDTDEGSKEDSLDEESMVPEIKTKSSAKVDLTPEDSQDLQTVKAKPDDDTWSNIYDDDDEDFSWEEEITEQPSWEEESIAQYSRQNGFRERFGSVPYGVEIRSCTRPGTVALTFDDGPNAILTGELLDMLDWRGVKATFFLNGDNQGLITDEGKAQHVVRMIESGHHVGSHGWSHLDMNEIDVETKRSEITLLEDALAGIIGGIPTYFRAPYGSCNQDCLSILDEYAYHVIRWDLDTNDWQRDLQASQDTITSAFASMDSANVLAHDIQDLTVESLAEFMIDTAEREGLELLTLGACMDDPPENWYRDPYTGGRWRPGPDLQFAQRQRDDQTTSESATETQTSSTASSTAADDATSIAVATSSSSSEACAVKDECNESAGDVRVTGAVRDDEDDEDDENRAVDSMAGRQWCGLVASLAVGIVIGF